MARIQCKYMNAHAYASIVPLAGMKPNIITPTNIIIPTIMVLDLLRFKRNIPETRPSAIRARVDYTIKPPFGKSEGRSGMS